MLKENFKTFLLLTILIQIYRFFVLLNAQIDLYVDEAYYWGWSQHLDFGYYSKPPMIAWVIALFTSICGESEICIKLPALILYPITSIFVYLTAKELFDERTAFWSAVAFLTLPAISLGSLIVSTDMVLLLFWSMALYFFIKAINSDKNLYWGLAAVAAGGGLLSKYTMIIFLLGVFCFLALDPRYRRHLKNPKLYLTILVAAIIYFPNLVWNAAHQYISFVHTKQISGIESGSHFHIGKMLEFLGAQFVVFGPIFFGVFLWLLWKRPKSTPYKLLLCFSAPFLAIITLQAFLSKALANWAAPTYVAATVLVAAYLLYRKKTKLLIAGIALNILLALGFYHYHAIAQLLGVQLTAKNDPYKRVRGYKELAKKLKPLIQRYPHAHLLFDDRTTMAEMIYYLRPHPFDAVMFNPSHQPKSQYHLFTDLNDHLGEDFLYVTASPINKAAPYFDRAQKIGTIHIPLYPGYERVYHLYLLQGFRGY